MSLSTYATIVLWICIKKYAARIVTYRHHWTFSANCESHNFLKKFCYISFRCYVFPYIFLHFLFLRCAYRVKKYHPPLCELPSNTNFPVTSLVLKHSRFPLNTISFKNHNILEAVKSYSDSGDVSTYTLHLFFLFLSYL